MKISRLTICWGQLIASITATIILGIAPLVRSILNHSDNFYKICFTVLICVGLAALINPSISELREALKTRKI